MKSVTVAVPEIGAIAVTRSMAGAGAALLLAGKMDSKKRKAFGWPLLAVGVLSTVPLVMHLIKNVKEEA